MIVSLLYVFMYPYVLWYIIYLALCLGLSHIVLTVTRFFVFVNFLLLISFIYTFFFVFVVFIFYVFLRSRGRAMLVGDSRLCGELVGMNELIIILIPLSPPNPKLPDSYTGSHRDLSWQPLRAGK